MSAWGRSLTSVSATATAATIVGQAPGFLIPLAIAYVIGATPETDAVFLVLSIGTVLINVLTAAVQHAGVPFFVASRSIVVDGRDPLVGHVLMVVGIVATVAALGVALLLPPLVAERLPDVSTGMLRLVCILLFPYVLIAGVNALWSAVLNAEGAYVAAAASPGLRSVVVLAIIGFGAGTWGYLAIAGGYIAGEAARAVFLWRRSNRRAAWPTGLPGEVRRAFLRNASAQGLGSLIVGAMLVLDRFFAASVGSGGVTLLEYADRLYQVPMSLAMSGFLVASVGEWSRRLEDGASVTELRASIEAATRRLVPLVLVGSLTLLAGRHVIVSILFSGAMLGTDALRSLGDTLGALSLGAPFYVAALIYTRPFLVLRRSEWLLIFSVVQLGLKWGLNALLVPVFGLAGIGLATTVVHAAAACGFWLVLRRKLMPIEGAARNGVRI